jgi:hypothetical protein
MPAERSEHHNEQLASQVIGRRVSETHVPLIPSQAAATKLVQLLRCRWAEFFPSEDDERLSLTARVMLMDVYAAERRAQLGVKPEVVVAGCARIDPKR